MGKSITSDDWSRPMSRETIPSKRPNLGRPTKYKPEYDEQAYELCLQGAIDTQLAALFKVCVDTIGEWKRVYPSFSSAIRRGKDELDSQVEKSLFKRAMGYEHPAVKIFLTKSGEVVEAPFIQRYAPDPTSMIFWLKNRRPKEWRESQQIEHTGTITHAVDAPPQETREEWIARKQRELNATKAIDLVPSSGQASLLSSLPDSPTEN